MLKYQIIANEIENFFLKNGADELAFDTMVASGKNSSMPHAVPTDKLIEPGDPITIDMGCKYKGYCSDMTRTIFAGFVPQYVKPIYEEDDIVSISEKIISLCQKRVVYKKDMKVGALAKFLSKFAMRSDAGCGVDNPYKMQFAINLCGRLKVIWAAIAGGVCKLFGKKGVFYEITGPEVSGLDGFYGHVFEDYNDFGIRIPENSTGVCNEIYEKLGIKAMIVDANDFNAEILGKSDVIKYNDEELAKMIKDNPAGQEKTLTPIVLIRRKK